MTSAAEGVESEEKNGVSAGVQARARVYVFILFLARLSILHSQFPTRTVGLGDIFWPAAGSTSVCRYPAYLHT